jgi:hypothetical protein
VDKIPVRVHGVEGTTRTPKAGGELRADEALKFFVAVKGHRSAISVVADVGITACILGELLPLPEGMQLLTDATWKQYKYLFGFELEAEPDTPDYIEYGEEDLALKLVSGELERAEVSALGSRLAAKAEIGPRPKISYRHIAGGYTLVYVRRTSDF